MEATLPISGEAIEWVENVAASQARQWLDRCDEFRRWERAQLLERKPGSDLLQSHLRASRFMISMTRLMLSTLADPEFFDRTIYKELEGTLWQLEAVWQMLHDPMDEKEADAILARVFPE